MEDTGRKGRLINHSRYHGNLVPKVIDVKGVPHVNLIAKKNIEAGEEHLYKYRDRKQGIENIHSWLIT